MYCTRSENAASLFPILPPQLLLNAKRVSWSTHMNSVTISFENVYKTIYKHIFSRYFQASAFRVHSWFTPELWHRGACDDHNSYIVGMCINVCLVQNTEGFLSAETSTPSCCMMQRTSINMAYENLRRENMWKEMFTGKERGRGADLWPGVVTTILLRHLGYFGS